MLKAFAGIKEARGEFLTSSICAEFSDELKQFSSDSRNDDAEFWEHTGRLGVDLFLQSGKRLKASIGFG